MIKVNDSHVIQPVDYASYSEQVEAINRGINARSLPGNDYLGWADYPSSYDKDEFARIKEAAKEIRSNYEALVVCGIGGSYLGARAAIEALGGLYPGKDSFPVYFVGNTFAPSYVTQVTDLLRGKKFAINVISKSGTTTETAVCFRLFQKMLIEQVGLEAANKAIYATTDTEKGALLELSKKYGYTRFKLASDIGGRYSVFTAVGLLPMAVFGIDIDAFMRGALNAQKAYDSDEINEAYKYAILRRALFHDRGYKVEMLVSYEPRFQQLGEWWKQLYGESEGKIDAEGNRSGLLPDSAIFSTDLHSLGQFIQEGSPVLFETVLTVKEQPDDLVVPHDEDNLDNLNYLAGKTLSYINEKAHDGTVDAHVNTGNVPNILIELEKMDAEGLGMLMYFFCRACAMSAYLNEVNPFNQPGVEVYKKNMFALLGKPGAKK